jgi:HPr kinase/phosphorylase
MSANIHASCVALGGKGVLLLGPSGAGKSDLALRLIDGGARLVADDRCELFVRAGKLCARAPDSIAGLIEMRGIGIIALPHAKSVAVAMAVRLGAGSARLPEPVFYSPPPGVKLARPVPLIMVKAVADSAPARIRAALAAFSQGQFRDTFNRKTRT